MIFLGSEMTLWTVPKLTSILETRAGPNMYKHKYKSSLGHSISYGPGSVFVMVLVNGHGLQILK